MRGVWDFLKDGFRLLFWEGFREGLIDLRPVGWDVRLLVGTGLLVVLVTLAATLLFGHGLVFVGEVTFEPDPDSTDTLSISFSALVLATAALLSPVTHISRMKTDVSPSHHSDSSIPTQARCRRRRSTK